MIQNLSQLKKAIKAGVRFDLQNTERNGDILCGMCLVGKILGTQTVPELPRAGLFPCNIPLLSLDKTKSVEELTAFQKDQQILMMLKLDGLTVKPGAQKCLKVTGADERLTSHHQPPFIGDQVGDAGTGAVHRHPHDQFAHADGGLPGG